MTQPTMIAPRDIVFEGEACPRCLAPTIGGALWPEMVMPLPQDAPPLARDGSGPCCHDCAAADGLNAIALPGKYEHLQHGDPETRTWWLMARVAVGNDRIEQLRLPGAPMGLVFYGLMAPSKRGDYEAHRAWLDSLGYFIDADDDEG